jgi:hypothetical protein
VRLALTNTQPVPVVRTLPGGCVAVSVPRSPFPGSATEVPAVLPADRLRLVSDVVLADGTRTAYFTAIRTGTATVSSTVRVRARAPVPEWSGLVIVV